MRRTFFLLLAAVLVASVCGAGRALAAGGTYRVIAGGNQDWSPSSGGLDQTSSDPLSVTGTMIGDNNAVGHADYGMQAGPGIVRARMAGSVTVPSGLFYPFNPSVQAISTTELTVAGPDGEINMSVNVHIDGFLGIPVCGSGACGGLGVEMSVGPFARQSELNSFGDSRVNTLGLAFDPVPGGYRVHGDVIGTAFGVRTNTPIPITMVLNVGGRFAGSPALSTFGGDFGNPVEKLQVSFDPAKPVLNDIPAGYTVSGPNVVDNHWTDPFAPPSGNVVVTSCDDPLLAGITTVNGSLIFRNLPGCPEISLPNLKAVHGDLIVEHNPGLTHVGFTGPVIVDGSVRIVDNGSANAIDVGDTSTGGDLEISGNQNATVISAGNGQIGGSIDIADNGAAVINIGDVTTVSGSIDISTMAGIVGAVTADGVTEITMLEGAAQLHAVLPAGAFDGPTGFTITYRFDDPAENGTAADGTTAVIDPIGTFVFAFDVPTLNSNAQLSFTVDMAQLDAVGRAALLNSLASGTATIVGKGDAAGSTYTAFPVCTSSQTPAADACVAIATLAADGTPTTGNPAFVRFDGVVGHFSSYAVARVLALDSAPPVITVPTGLTVDATAQTGARVTYAASAHDDRDLAPTLVCTPASGTVFAIGNTTVSCLATDAAGNAATARFMVHVRGAGEQIAALIGKTVAFLDLPALKPAVSAALQSAADSLVARNPRAACLGLNVYMAAVKLAPAKAFTAAERAELVADAIRIRAVIGC